MTERERKIAVLLTSILQGDLTVSQLRRRVADGKAQLEKLGPSRVKRLQLDASAAAEEALKRIEREKVKYDRHTNN